MDNIPTNKEVMNLFPHFYEGYKPTTVEVEVDEELGLEIVHRESLESKYYLPPLPDNSFITSLRRQFAARGSLSSKQIACLRK